MSAWVYLLANRPRGAIYTGVTSNLVQRVWQHKNDVLEGFTKHYRIHDLVYLEEHTTVLLAIQREHNIKHWKRRWKVELIEGMNPKWDDLYAQITR